MGIARSAEGTCPQGELEAGLQRTAGCQPVPSWESPPGMLIGREDVRRITCQSPRVEFPVGVPQPGQQAPVRCVSEGPPGAPRTMLNRVPGNTGRSPQHPSAGPVLAGQLLLVPNKRPEGKLRNTVKN